MQMNICLSLSKSLKQCLFFFYLSVYESIFALIIKKFDRLCKQGFYYFFFSSVTLQLDCGDSVDMYRYIFKKTLRLFIIIK